MYIVCIKDDNVVIGCGANIGTLNNGYIILVDENVAYAPNDVNVYEINGVPNDYVREKYCYTEEDGFFLNPNYEEPNPYGIPNEVYNSILDDYTNELIESGVL